MTPHDRLSDWPAVRQEDGHVPLSRVLSRYRGQNGQWPMAYVDTCYCWAAISTSRTSSSSYCASFVRYISVVRCLLCRWTKLAVLDAKMWQEVDQSFGIMAPHNYRLEWMVMRGPCKSVVENHARAPSTGEIFSKVVCVRACVRVCCFTAFKYMHKHNVSITSCGIWCDYSEL